MPYPSKITAQSIVAAAIAQLESHDAAELSLRGVAVALGITPHALYRYFADRAALEAAIAAQSYGDLLTAMQAATLGCAPLAAVEAAARAYLTFALAHPARYRLMLAAPHDPAAKSSAQHAVWAFVMQTLARVTGQAENEGAALALWALLHGFVALTEAGVTDDATHITQGLTLFLAGLAHFHD